MADFWGPALDAELAYRHERLFTALRGIPYGTRTPRGATPSPTTEGLDGDRPSGRLAAAGAARAPAGQCRAWVAAARIGGMARGSMSTPFVARAPQVDQLTLALQRAGVGEPVDGPARRRTPASARPGCCGTSRSWRTRPGARVVVAHCVDLGEIGLPYLPFAEALSQLRALDPDAVDAVVANRPALARLLPGPVRVGGGPGRPVEPAPAVRRAGRGARRGRRPGPPAAARARGPALGGRVEPGRAALPRLAAARPAPARRRQLPHRRPAPAAPVAARRRGAGAGTRASSGWTCPRSPTTSCASSPPRSAGAPLTESTLRRVIDRSEGNAYFAEELLEAGAEADELPWSLADVLRARLELLDPSVQRLARIASAAGRRVSEPLLRAAVAADGDPQLTAPGAVDAALREAVAHHVLGRRGRAHRVPARPAGRGRVRRPAARRAVVAAPRVPARAARRPVARPVVAARLARPARARPADRAAGVARRGRPGARGARARRGAAAPRGRAAAVGGGARGHGEPLDGSDHIDVLVAARPRPRAAPGRSTAPSSWRAPAVEETAADVPRQASLRTGLARYLLGVESIARRAASRRRARSRTCPTTPTPARAWALATLRARAP